jgi:hypothetical protein
MHSATTQHPFGQLLLLLFGAVPSTFPPAKPIPIVGTEASLLSILLVCFASVFSYHRRHYTIFLVVTTIIKPRLLVHQHRQAIELYLTFSSTSLLIFGYPFAVQPPSCLLLGYPPSGSTSLLLCDVFSDSDQLVNLPS